MGRRKGLLLCAKLAQGLPRLCSAAARGCRGPALLEAGMPGAALHTLPSGWAACTRRESLWTPLRPPVHLSGVLHQARSHP